MHRARPRNKTGPRLYSSSSITEIIEYPSFHYTTKRHRTGHRADTETQAKSTPPSRLCLSDRWHRFRRGAFKKRCAWPASDGTVHVHAIFSDSPSSGS